MLKYDKQNLNNSYTIRLFTKLHHMEDFKKLFQFMRLVGNLKSLKRTGWVRKNVHEPETVSGHMYRMAILSFLIDEERDNINRDKCIKMCLVHDLAECIVGDITPHDNITPKLKQENEKKAMHEICELVPNDIGKNILQLWTEYENQSCNEALFVKDLDRFDMILQAYEYEIDKKVDQKETKDKPLQEFFNSVRGTFKHKLVCNWVKELENVRNS